MPRTALNSRRSRTSCSIIALATVLAVGATPAAAQSFNGTGTYVSNPNATGITTGVNTTTINLNPGQTVINWTPTDNATNTTANIVFQNSGTTATFTSTGDFAVLNNINSASINRAIEMNGTVRARVGGLQRGSVYFYAPGGFLFGGGSSFSVGSLVVSALPIQVTSGSFIANPGTNNTVVFGQAVNPNAAIVNNGTINASIVTSGVPSSSNSSYVAMVAPRVEHNGAITVNGSAALVAAEAATMSFSPDGLFDIAVSVGTTSTDGIEVNGDIGGATPSGATREHRAYLVAVPKNDALTMVIGSGADLGFTLANDASVDQYGAVVLSAGHDVTDGQIGGRSAGHGASATANLQVSGAHFTNNVTGEATGNADIFASGGGLTKFDSDLTVHADGHTWMSSSGAGSLVNVLGDVFLSTDAFATTNGGSATGGYTSLFTNNSGAVTIGGDLTMTADGYGNGGDGVAGGTGTGGHAQVQNFNGTITIGSANSGGNVYLSASGWGGEGFGSDGGLGKGGFAEVTSENGTLTINHALDVEALGTGGSASGVGRTSGDGEGGHAMVRAQANSTVAVGEDLDVEASGRGGFVGFRALSGDGTGGNIEVQAQGGNSTLNLNTGGGETTLEADGEAGDDGECEGCGGGIGNGVGGDVVVGSNNGSSLLLHSNLTMHANGIGALGVDADGGNGTGGLVQLYAADNSTTDLDGSLFAHADGIGGSRMDGGFGAGLPILAGNGTGGLAELFTFGTAGTNPQLHVAGNVNLYAEGDGGSVIGVPGGVGGDGTGGQSWLDAQLGSIDIDGNAFLVAVGHGGDAAGGTGGNGFGRNAEIDGIGGDVSITGSAFLDVRGFGGAGLIGGVGTGGGEIFDDGTWVNGALIYAQASSVTIGGATTMSAQGIGGNGDNGDFSSNGGAGGNGFGGYATVRAANSNLGPSNITLSTLNISASATGGDGGVGGPGNQGGDGGDGGDATAGQADVFATAGNGHLAITTVNATATARGGAGGDGGNGDNLAGGNGGAGGNATGGFVEVGTGSGLNQAATSNLGTATYGTVTADSSAIGGDGGNGNFGTPDGNGGTGGTADAGKSVLLVRGSHVTVTGATTLTANGSGGDGGLGGGDLGKQGVGGDGIAGEVSVQATARFQHPDQTGTLTTGAIIGTAIGSGGLGAVNGASIVEGGSNVIIDRSAAHIASLNFTITGDEVAVGSDPSRISITNVPPGVGQTVGTVAVDGTFSFDTIGDLSLYVVNGNLAAPTINLAAGNFITDPENPPASGVGTIFADNVFISTDQDFVADANWDVTNTFIVDAPGLIALDHVHDDNGIDFSAGGSINVDVDAGTYVDLLAGGNIGTSDVTAGSSVRLQSTGGSIDVGNISANSFVTLLAGTFILGEDIITGGSISAQTTSGDIRLETLTSTFESVTVNSGGDLFIVAGDDPVTDGDIFADGNILLTADGLIDMNDATGGFFRAQAGSTVDAGNITSDSNIQVFAGGNVTLANLDAGLTSDLESNKAIRIDIDGSLLVGNIVADGGIDVTAGGSVTGGNVTTGDVLITEADGAINYLNISAGLVNPQVPTEPFSAVLDSATSITVGNVAAALGIGFVTSGTLTTADLTTGTDVLALVHGAVNIGDIDAGARVLLADSSMFTNAGGTIGDAGDDNINPETIFAAAPVKTNGSITVHNVDVGSFTAAAGANLTVGTLDADGGISLDAGAAITTGNLNVGDFVLANGGSITTGTILANSVDMTSTAGNISTGTIDAFGDVLLNAFGDILTGRITAGTIDLSAGDDITTGDLTTQQLVLLLAMEGPGPQFLVPGASITLEAGGDISTGTIDSIDGVYANAAGGITTGTIDAVDWVELFAGGNISTGAINAGDFIFAEAGGNIATGVLNAGDDVEFENGGNLSFSSANVGSSFSFETDGSVSGGAIFAGNQITGEAGGTINLGNLTVTGPLALGEDFSIGMSANGSIAVQNVSATNPIGFATHGNLTSGNVTAGGLFMVLAGGNVTTGSITTTGAFGQVYLADDSMFETGGGTVDSDDNFDASIVLALHPVATGGAITINGPVNTDLLRAAAGTSLTTQAVNAEDAIVSAGGLATINGAWNVGDAQVTSNDIDITAAGSITAAGDIALVSSNATRTIVGNGVNLAGYNVSEAEFAKLHANDVTVIADTSAGAAANMIIGTLNVNAAGFPGGVDYEFLTGNSQTETASGSIRVVGNAVFNGMTSGNHSVNFGTALFELDATTGSISLFSSGTTLGGELGLYADRIHVASGAILNQLASNPTYTGYQQDLNEAADVQRPDGVLRADTLWIESDNLQDVLIQNTGTGGPSGTPAGFLVRQAFINDDQAVAGPPGSINLVVNGQVVTEGGTLTGVEARDALVEGADISPFTANSTINGCPLSGECIIAPPPPPPTADVVDNQIDLITGGGLGDGDFGNEDSIDDNEEGDEGAQNPIAPPQPLFDTRPLIPNDDVNDPVSGTGNPALLGSDPDCDEQKDQQCPASPVKGDGQ